MRGKRIVAAGLVGAGLLFTAGCGNASDKTAEKVAEQIAKANGASGVDVDIDSDGGGVKVTTDDGTFSANGDSIDVQSSDGAFSGGSKVPAEWPKEVPLPDDLEVGFGGTQKEGGKTVVSVNGKTKQSAAQLLATLKSALGGWAISDENTLQSNGATVASANWTKDSRTLEFVASETGDGSTSLTMAYTTGG